MEWHSAGICTYSSIGISSLRFGETVKTLHNQADTTGHLLVLFRSAFTTANPRARGIVDLTSGDGVFEFQKLFRGEADVVFGRSESVAHVALRPKRFHQYIGLSRWPAMMKSYFSGSTILSSLYPCQSICSSMGVPWDERSGTVVRPDIS